MPLLSLQKQVFLPYFCIVPIGCELSKLLLISKNLWQILLIQKIKVFHFIGQLSACRLSHSDLTELVERLEHGFFHLHLEVCQHVSQNLLHETAHLQHPPKEMK